VKIQFAALPLLAALAAPAFAGPCVALDYQEMKDMPADELVKEACKARAALDQNYNENELNLNTRSGPKPFPNAQDNFDMCAGQITRIDRVLESKGMRKDSVNAACKTEKVGAGK
jgi:hypothetical protein